jgi:WD40 repeat protein
MKTIIISLLCLFSFVASHSQTFSVFGANSTNFPNIQALFYANNAQGQRINNLNPASFTISENGVQRKVISVSCPPDATPAKISSVLVIDVSGSMAGGGLVKNMELAKNAARSWIKQLPSDGSECAITSFDTYGYLNQDFTNDKKRLIDAVDALHPAGGTNYNAGFIAPNASLDLLQRAKYKRILVFLTDGQGTISEQDVLTKAKAVNAVVYCVGVNLSLPDALKNIAEQTKGAWFENVGSTESIESIYSRILELAVSGSPCELVWETNLACSQLRQSDITINSPSMQGKVEYVVPAKYLPSISFSKLSARFPDVPPGKTDSHDITITAQTDSIRISSITSLNPDFIIENAPSPIWNLNRGESKTFRIRFVPTDSSLTFAEIHIAGNMCFGSTMYAIGGYSGYRKPSAQLRVVAPNGGERFSVGDTTTLRWTGVLPIDTVRLDYSVDAGLSWIPIANKATGLTYNWTIPPTPSNQCLLRAMQYRQRGTDTVIRMTQHTSIVTGACFSPDGTRVASVSSTSFSSGSSGSGNLIIWDAATGLSITPPIVTKTLSNYCVDWSPDGQRIAVGSSGVELYDGTLFSLVQTIFSGTIASCVFTLDGKYLVTNNSSFNKVGLWSVQTQNSILLTSGHTGGINHVSVVANSPQNFTVLTASGDRSARRTHIDITKDDIPNGLVATSSSSADFTSSDVGIAYLANPTDSGSACAVFQNGDLQFYPSKIVVRPFGGDVVNEADWSPDGKFIAFALNSGVLAIVDVATKTITRILDTVHKSALSIRWDVTSTRVVAGFTNNLALVWQVAEQIDQQDVSDAVWEIVTPTLSAAKEVDFGDVRVNTSRDSVVQAIICITQNPLSSSRIDSAIIFNDPDGVFRIVSGVPAQFATSLPACLSIELGFSPKKIGNAIATLRIFSNGKFFDVSLIGNGIDLGFIYPELVIDFGKVPVGTWKDSLINPSTVNLAKGFLNITQTSIAGPDMKQFFVIGGDTTILLKSGEFARLQLRFAPKVTGRTSSRVRIEFIREGIQPTSSASVYIQLFGEGVCGIDSTRTFNVGLGQEALAVVGAIVQVPLVMNLQSGQSRDAITSKFFCTISYDASMLISLDPLPIGIRAGNRRVVTFEADRLANSDTLMLLPLLTLLGTDSIVTVRIDSLYFDDGGCPINVRADSVTIKLTDLCRAGGSTRLLTGSPITQIILLPNPANEKATILLTLAEDSPITLSIHNMLGQEIMVQHDILSRGNHRLFFDSEQLPVGMYSFILSTRSEVKFIRFVKQ